jgi:hypothetical protein
VHKSNVEVLPHLFIAACNLCVNHAPNQAWAHRGGIIQVAVVSELAPPFVCMRPVSVSGCGRSAMPRLLTLAQQLRVGTPRGALDPPYTFIVMRTEYTMPVNIGESQSTVDRGIINIGDAAGHLRISWATTSPTPR